jgi:hypothetical protein
MWFLPNTKKVYFDIVIEGNIYSEDYKDIESNLTYSQIDSIMNFANISFNNDFRVIDACLTNKKPYIKNDISPEQRKQNRINTQKEIYCINRLNDNKPLIIDKDSVDIENRGLLTFEVEEIDKKVSLDMGKIWQALEKNIVGKIKEGDKIELKDDNGNLLFRLQGGSFLCVANADVKLYPQGKILDSYFDRMTDINAGFFIREDGNLDMGDFDRTFYLSINLGNLSKAYLKNQNVLELFQNLKLN